MTIGNATISDSHKHGMLTVAEVIQKSSNIGVAKIALSFPPEQMWTFFDKLGFGAPLGLGFPGEAGGRLRPAKTWRPIEQATMSYGSRHFGHRDADGPCLSHLCARWRARAGVADQELGTPAAGRKGFSAQTAREIRAMLEMVVARRHRTGAQISGYRVGGKTGTAQKLEGGRYSRRYVASFVGIAPMSDPRLVIAVMVDEPSGKEYYGGGQVAAARLRSGRLGALRALGVAPDARWCRCRSRSSERGAGAHVNQAAIRSSSGCVPGVQPRRPERRFEKRGRPARRFLRPSGQRSDGRRFIAEALARGPSAVLWEEALGGRAASTARCLSLAWKACANFPGFLADEVSTQTQ